MKASKFFAVLLIICITLTTLVGCAFSENQIDTAYDDDVTNTQNNNDSTTSAENTNPPIPVDANTDSDITEKYDGITVTKLPYFVKGIVVQSISFDGTKVIVRVTNYSGNAIDYLSSIECKCYDTNDIILSTNDLYLADMNNGETADVYFYAEDGTSKILFGDATIYQDNASSEQETSVYDGIIVNKLPYKVKGLEVIGISFEGTKVTVRVTNNTGAAIDGLSNINYKCYNSDGIIIDSNQLFLSSMNNGETADVYFYAEEGTSKIIFVDATIYESETSGNQETAVYDGITVTKLPYEVKGLKVIGISFDGTKVTVRVTNNTGAAIDGLSHINYKCYDSNGVILSTSDLFLVEMNNGETADVYFYAEEGTAKILFGDATVYEGQAINTQETAVYYGITVTKLPYEIKGLKVIGISFDGMKVTVRVTNNTGAAIDDLSNINYKCYNSDGIIISAAQLFLVDMNNGETADVYFYAEEGTSKIIFGDATVYEGQATINQETAVYNGITVNKLPYEINGLTIVGISFEGTKVTVRVTNNTGAIIDQLTNINYKCYDSNGVIIDSDCLFLADMNNGETADVYFYAEKGTSKILFGDATIYN